MNIKILDGNKTEKGTKSLPVQFSEEIREDIIQRAVLSIQSHRVQPYGTDPRAGQKQVSWISKRRRDYKTSYGHGISRVPRKVLSHSGTQFNWVGAKMPGTVGGRVAHPPKTSKIWEQKINTKENRKAIRSAISATINTELVKARGHRIPKEFPFAIDHKIESSVKTAEVQKMLEKLGFSEELQRTSERTIRAGKGKNRGRKHKMKTGPLFVVSKECSLMQSAKNIPGVDVVQVKNINAELLAPGCHAGRLTLWTDAAIDILANEKLFTNEYVGPKPAVKETREKEKAKAPAKTRPSQAKNQNPKSMKAE
jgi:large subunit ribosomal protein L4e